MIPQVVTGYAVFAPIAAGYILHLLPSVIDAAAQRIGPCAAGSGRS